MRTFHKIILCIISTLTVVWLQGCKAEKTGDASMTAGESAESQQAQDSYANSHLNCSSAEFLCFKTLERMTNILDYESMNNVSLCSKPNCNHKAKDCIVKRLDGHVPVFGEQCAYYFVDQEPKIQETEDGKTDLVLGSDLYCYDFRTNAETKLFHADASVSDSCYGWLLHNDVLYYIDNQYSRSYDETGMICASGNTGGNMSLCAVRLSDLQSTTLCKLYDVEKLTEYYPVTPDSGEVYMKGLFDNKIYFDVCFVDEQKPRGTQYCSYVTYYDLSDGTYHGTPEEYGNIDFAEVGFLSEDYLVICRDGRASVYKKGSEQPVILEDADFNQYTMVSVFDDVLFFRGKVFDLNTGTVRSNGYLCEKDVVAKYGDSFIISDYGMQSGFEKIPAEQLLN